MSTLQLSTHRGTHLFHLHSFENALSSIHVVVATAVTLGGCPEERRTPIVALTPQCAADSTFCVQSDAYTCDVEHGIMTSGTTWLGLLGLTIITVLLIYKQRSAFIIGIGFVTIVSWFRDTAVTYFPDTPEGDARFDYFQQVVNVEGMSSILTPFTQELSEVGVALITFLYVDFLDTSGTLMGLTSALGYVDEDGNFPRSRAAFSSDAVATMFGSIFGLSPWIIGESEQLVGYQVLIQAPYSSLVYEAPHDR